jgi:hypothetical protein
MRKIVNLAVSLSLLVALITYSSCGPNPEPELSKQDQQLQKLLATTERSGTKSQEWVCTAATLSPGSVDKAANYVSTTSPFTLTLSGEIAKTIAAGASASFSYTTTKPTFSITESPTSPWAKSGSFTFDATAPETKVSRDDGTAVQYTVSETELSISFNFSKTGYDRSTAKTDVVVGDWNFKFKKK